ncbi:MAG: prenyltransferase/squalene oxidase repeat-containing protein [Patescibacteria group bacterium]|nr:prenyltransferase/squalene oxidase repeat-containing protein [Patescibacteria group bacterium]
MRTIFLIGLVVLTVMFTPTFVLAGVPEAVTYLSGQTQDAWITQALIAAGETDAAISYLNSVPEGGFNPANDYAKTILALAAAGESPTTFGEIDYVAKLKSYYDGSQMGDASLLNDDIWSILALASVYQVDSTEAVAAKDFLIAKQNADGGWGYDLIGGSDTNDTAAAIMALIETGISAGDPIIVKALDYLHSLQNADGGFPYNPLWGADSDSGSDAWVISALSKVGQDPASWTKEENNPLTHLQSLQDPDGGFWWIAGESEYNNKAMTPYAVIALSGKSFPVGYYQIPQLTKLTADKSTLDSGESITMTVEYYDGQSWLGLEGATVKGGDQDYITDSSGQAVAVLPSGSYVLFAEKDGFVSSDEIEVVVSAPVPTGGGGFSPPAPTSCASVEYDQWQDVCADGWQYRNVLSLTPANCVLTTEQEGGRKRTCVDAQEKNSATSQEDKEIKNEKEIEKVLGVKVVNPDILGAVEDATGAGMIYFSNAELMAADIGAKRDLNKEKEGENKYTEPLIGDRKDLSSEQTDAITNFIVYGTKNVQKLGAGERAGVLNSYKSTFNKLPTTPAEWEEAIKVSNGILPGETNSEAEDKAKIEFKKVYQREVNKDNFGDKTAIDMMAYGLRPGKRDLDSERNGLKVFTEVYNYRPTSARDWDIVRAIAYSGAIK